MSKTCFFDLCLNLCKLKVEINFNFRLFCLFRLFRLILSVNLIYERFRANTKAVEA